MAIGFGVPVPKGRTRKQFKAAKKRVEAAVIKRVREHDVARDGFCRLQDERCDGVSEWAHLDGFKRFQTRGREPEYRHQTAQTLMLCTFHHRHYDRYAFVIEFRSKRGADGQVRGYGTGYLTKWV